MDLKAWINLAREMDPSLPNGTGGAARHTWALIAHNSVERAQREGRATYCDLFDEATAAVMETINPMELRVKLIRVGALTLKWLMDLDVHSAEGRG